MSQTPRATFNEKDVPVEHADRGENSLLIVMIQSALARTVASADAVETLCRGYIFLCRENIIHSEEPP
jgi:hypothetical protein